MSFAANWKLSVVAITLLSFPVSAFAQSIREVPAALASTSFLVAPIRIAQEMGFFEKRGIRIRPIAVDGANAALAALVSGSVEVILANAGELVASNANNQQVVAINRSYTGFGGSLVLSKAAASKLKVTANDPVRDRFKALDGLVISTASPTASFTLTYKSAAEAVGANVRFTYMSQPAAVAAFQKGAIDGLVASAPFWANAIANDAGIMWINGANDDLPMEFRPSSGTLVMVMRQFAQANPSVVKAVADGMAEVGIAAEQRPDDVKAVLAKLYPDSDAKSLDILFKSEAGSWKVKPLTRDDMIRDLAYVKASGVKLPAMDSLDPSSLLFP